MKKIIHFILFTVILSINSYGQTGKNMLRVQQVIMELRATDEYFHPVNLFGSPEQRKVVGIGTYIRYIIDTNELRKAFKANYKSIRFTLPLPGGILKNLLLTRHQILTDDFKLTGTNEKGKHEIEYLHGLYYYGTIEGNNQRSMVTCSIFKNELACIISDENGNWNLGPLKATKTLSQVKENGYAFYNNKTFHLPLKFTCESEDGVPIGNLVRADKGQTLSSAGKCVRVYFDCDYDTYKFFGNNAGQAANYIITMFNEISTLYSNENISVAISEIHVWDHQDPYKIPTTAAELAKFKDNTPSFNGDIAHLLRFGNGNSAGRAFLPGLCNGNGYGVDIIFFSYPAQDFIFPTYTRDAEVVAHEMGHNLGSPHTHDCVWNGNDTKIDRCGDVVGNDNCCNCSVGAGNEPLPANGTIMSYCDGTAATDLGAGINFIYGFGPQPGNRIRNGVANAGCLTNCTLNCLPVISVANPVTPGDYVQFYASGIIYGSSTVQNGAAAVFSARDSVIFRKGFYAQAGCHLLAQNAPCPSFASIQQYDSSAVHSIDNSLNSLAENTDIKIIPNPFNSTFDLYITSNKNIKAQVIFYNTPGEKIKEKAGINISKGINKLSFNCSDLPPGVYLVEINIGYLKTVKRIVKM